MKIGDELSLRIRYFMQSFASVFLATTLGILQPQIAIADTKYFSDFPGWEQHTPTSEMYLTFSGSVIEGEEFRVVMEGWTPGNRLCQMYIWLLDNKTILGRSGFTSGMSDIILEPMIAGPEFESATFGGEVICNNDKYKTRFLRVEFDGKPLPPIKTYQLKGFTAKQHLLTNDQKKSIWLFLNSNVGLKSLKCTPAASGLSTNKIETDLANKRALSTCNYAKTLKKDITTSLGKAVITKAGKVSRVVNLSFSG
jgi:hypothetical protein